jgi:hypothetical protein
LIQHTFALDHGSQNELACQTCHPTTYQDNTCYTCHDHTPEETVKQHQSVRVSAEALAQCAGCHPTGRPGEAVASPEEGGTQ